MTNCDQHTLIFDGGFNVCIRCGTCSYNEQDYRYANEDCGGGSIGTNKHEYILQNNNIGFLKEIDQMYRSIQHLSKSFSLIELYAFAAYSTIVESQVYYSLSNIGEMFGLFDFAKKYCKIKNKLKMSDTAPLSKEHYKSGINIYLAKNNLQKHNKKCFLALEKILDRFDHFDLKPSIFMASVLCACVLEVNKRQICDYFNVNIRSVSKIIKNVF